MANKIIGDHQRKVGNYFVTISEQTRVLVDLCTTIKKLDFQVSIESKSEMDKPIMVADTQRASETNVASKTRETQKKETERVREPPSVSEIRLMTDFFDMPQTTNQGLG